MSAAWCWRPRASSPPRSSRRRARWSPPAGSSVAAVYGGVGFEKQTREARAAHIVVATPGRLEDLLAAPRHLARAPSRSSSSTRPTGCSTWASAPPSTASSRSARATARRCSSRPRSTARPAGSPTPTPTTRCATSTSRRAERAADIEHRFVAVDRDEPASTRSSASCGPTRELTLVFVRTKRGADRLVKRLSREGVRAVGHARQQVPEPARARARRVRRRGGRHARGHRRRRPRHRRHRHLARDQLRRARRTATATSTASGAPAAPGAPASGSRSSRPSRPATSARSPRAAPARRVRARRARRAATPAHERPAQPPRPPLSRFATPLGPGEAGRTRRSIALWAMRLGRDTAGAR